MPDNKCRRSPRGPAVKRFGSLSVRHNASRGMSFPKANPKAKALPTGDSVKRLKDAERKRESRAAEKSKRPYDQSDPPVPERLTMIVEYLRTHPDSTIKEIITGLGFVAEQPRIMRWHHHFQALVKAQMIAHEVRKDRPGPGNPKQFRLVDPMPVALGDDT